MTYEEIKGFAPVNATDPEKVAAIAASIRENGWTGAPILVAAASGILITGSHRLAALRLIDEEDGLDDLDVAEDVQDLIDAWCEENDASLDDIDFSSLANVFRGTRIEQYKNEMEEW